MPSTRRFKPPCTLFRENSACYTVQDANNVTVAGDYEIISTAAEKAAAQ